MDEEHNLTIDRGLCTKQQSAYLKLKNYLDLEDLLQQNDWTILKEIYDPFRHENVGRQTIHKIFNFSRQDVIDIFRIIARDIPKRRTVVFYGPSNCGKSLLANALAKPFSPGYIQRDGGTNVHWLENIYRKSLILWEEPSIHMTNIEDVKLLLGGENIVINRKNKHLVERLNGAAVIITTNREFWEYEPETIKNRCYIKYLSVSVESVTKQQLHLGEILDYLLDLLDD